MEAINILIGRTVAKVAALKKISFLPAGLKHMPKHVKEQNGKLLYRASNMIVLLELSVSDVVAPGDSTQSVVGSAQPAALYKSGNPKRGHSATLSTALPSPSCLTSAFPLFFLFNSVGGNENISTVTTLPSKCACGACYYKRR